MIVRVRRWLWCGCLLLAAAGCTRTHYRLKADRDAYCILAEKTAERPWQPPPGFMIQPDPRSRFYDPSCLDDPSLPIPAPRLYAYDLPELPYRDPGRFRGLNPTPADAAPIGAGSRPQNQPDNQRVDDTFVQQAACQKDVSSSRLIALLTGAELPPLPTDELPVPDGQPEQDAERSEQSDSDDADLELILVPIPQVVWESLPTNCLTRMFEFRSVREEYGRTYGKRPSADKRDPSRRLALEDIVELALINSREYQTEKETLYRVALRLSLRRFDYDLNFATGGNRTALDTSHDRVGGTTVDTLRIPTTITGSKLLATGGDLLARFANDVVLTFNGPDGFAADIGSELLLDVSQSVFQRDIVFEGLTQAERDVVYAARRFARFRKELFRDLASEYYSLILSYRAIEIVSQDYFSNLRAFYEGEAEYREVGRGSRIDVDQIEQSALSSRSQLIGSCNSLESDLDRLKLRIGLPPELPVNLDFTELEMLTLRDEATVWGERVRRARRNLMSARQQPALDHSVLVNAAIDLTRRTLHLAELRGGAGHEPIDLESLELLLARLSADEARQLVRQNREVLEQEKGAASPQSLRVFQRTMGLASALDALVNRQLQLTEQTAVDPNTMEDISGRRRQLEIRVGEIEERWKAVIAGRQLDRVPGLVTMAETLLADADTLAEAADDLVQYVQTTSDEERRETLRRVDHILEESQRLLADETGGLAPVEVDTDDAMLTALARRFDLMNQRGVLADVWRQIKLAGDDLKSVLNLNASQSIRTRANRPFGFTFDESQTRLSLTLDTPLNREVQRNAFRESLIDYQAALRNVIQLEDDVTLSIRDDLRQLLLDREQYQIAVASAALAYDRVVSTRLELRLAVRDVQARDFLEAQQAYTASLIEVARQHIRYIRDRIQLFLNLELLDVDDDGFWPELYNEQHQPTVDCQWPRYARPPYGELPRRVRHSPEVKRMLSVPMGCSQIYARQPHQPQEKASPPELGPPGNHVINRHGRME